MTRLKIELSPQQHAFLLAVFIYPTAAADARLLRHEGIEVTGLELAKSREKSMSEAELDKVVKQAKARYPDIFEC